MGIKMRKFYTSIIHVSMGIFIPLGILFMFFVIKLTVKFHILLGYIVVTIPIFLIYFLSVYLADIITSFLQNKQKQSIV
jgi:hypothetical protein